MTAMFSLSPVDSATLEWPELPEPDASLDVLAPTPWAPPGAEGWRELGACMDELAATRALNELLDARARSARHRAGMYLRASFAVECNPVRRVPVHGSRAAFAMPYRGAGGSVSPPPESYRGPANDAVRPPVAGPSLSVRSWLANLAPLAALALLLGAWFMWSH